MNSPAMGGGVLATMQGAYPHTTKLIESFTHNLKRLKGSLYNIDRKINDVNTELSKLKVDYASPKIRISNKYVNSYLIKSSSCFCNFTYILLSVLA